MKTRRNFVKSSTAALIALGAAPLAQAINDTPKLLVGTESLVLPPEKMFKHCQRALKQIEENRLNLFIWPRGSGKTTVVTHVNGFVTPHYTNSRISATHHTDTDHFVLDETRYMHEDETPLVGWSRDSQSFFSVKSVIDEGYKVTIFATPNKFNNDWLVSAFNDFTVDWWGCSLRYDDLDREETWHTPEMAKSETFAEFEES